VAPNTPCPRPTSNGVDYENSVVYLKTIMLSEAQIGEFKKKLEEEGASIEREIKGLEKIPEFGTDVTDFNEEEADEAEEWSTNIGIAEPLKERLREVKNALGKIAEERYGKCESRGEEIDAAVLSVNPESRFCQACMLKARK